MHESDHCVGADDKGGRPRNIEGVQSNHSMHAICLGRVAAFIEQEREGDGMFPQKFFGPEIPFRFSAAMKTTCAPLLSISFLRGSN